MIAAWMAYSLVIAALVSVAALIAERVAILRHLPARWIWAAALLLSLALPVLLGWQGGQSSEQTAATLLALAAKERPPIYAQSPIVWIGGDTGTPARGVSSDTALLLGWSALSALVLGTLSMGWVQLRRRLRSALDGEVDGVSVSITYDVGPAVVGVRRPRIAIPRWLLQQDAQTQRIVIAHEREHMLAQDIRVLGAALVVAVLLPWNLPIWWQLRRLRFAMEIDCDARVLRGGHSRSTYSAVLLNVATRLVPLRAAAAGLSESSSSLEQRVRIMHAPVRKRWRLLAVLLGTCSVTLIAVAANVTAPPARTMTASHFSGGLPLLPTPVAAQRDDEAKLASAVGYFYPQLLTTQQEGRPHVWAVVNERGEVSHIDMNVHPAWYSEADFARIWEAYRQRAGVMDEQMRQQLVQHIRIGPNWAVVAWIMQLGAVSRDATAPTFEVAPRVAQATQARMLATTDAQRRVIEHFDPAALSEGVPDGQELWFLIDADGNVQRVGRRATIVDPQTARLAMQKMFPDISVGYVTRGTAAKDISGKRIAVSWQWLERD